MVDIEGKVEAGIRVLEANPQNLVSKLKNKGAGKIAQ